MKQLLYFFLIAAFGVSFAQETSNSYDLKVAVTRAGDRFQVNASYEVPINVCEAFAFITDYEGAKILPGIVESKVLSRSGNKVKVARLLEERILFIPFEMRSELEFVELPNKALLFEQISGDTKYYKGSWRLLPEKDFTTFKYDAQVEPNSLVPSAVIEFFIKNIVRRQFESMAEMASLKRLLPAKSCRQ
jgi:ribosome-associated toxin RatA of RatAB toxin-antitoxin module